MSNKLSNVLNVSTQDKSSPFYEYRIIDLDIIEQAIETKINGYYWSFNDHKELNRQITYLQDLADQLEQVLKDNGEIIPLS